jgi:hypothetical protein
MQMAGDTGSALGGDAPLGSAGANRGTAGEGPVVLSPLPGPYELLSVAPNVGMDYGSRESVVWNNAILAGFDGAAAPVKHDIGTCKAVDVGFEGALQWGRWTDGHLAGTDDFLLTAAQGLHYVIGTAPFSVPASGIDEYEQIGSTKVTLADGSAQPGDVTAKASLLFGNPLYAGVELTASIGGVDYQVSSSGGVASPVDSEVHSSPLIDHPPELGGSVSAPNGGVFDGKNCAAALRLFLAGPDGQYLGLSYSFYTDQNSDGPNIFGVVALKKR